METDEKLKTPIGTLEKEKMKALPVTVVDVKVEPPRDRTGKILTDANDKPYADKVKLFCKHPESEGLIEISQAKVLSDEKIKEYGLWFSLDKESKLMKNSALALMLKHYKVESLSELGGKELETTLDKKGYLCIKSY